MTKLNRKVVDFETFRQRREVEEILQQKERLREQIRDYFSNLLKTNKDKLGIILQSGKKKESRCRQAVVTPLRSKALERDYDR